MSVLVRTLSLLCALGLAQAFVNKGFQINLRTQLTRYQEIHDMMKAQYENLASQKVTMMGYNMDLLHMLDQVLPDKPPQLDGVIDYAKKFTHESDHLLDLMLHDFQNQIKKYEQLIEKYKNYADFLDTSVTEL